MLESSRDMTERLAAWTVTPTGPGFSTASSELRPGTHRGVPVMLKIARVDEEVRGAALLQWWAGHGAAPVLAREGAATLMLRATGPRDLAAMAASGQDPAATEVLVRTALDLHDRPAPAASDGVVLIPLRDWFRDLLSSGSHDPLLQRAAAGAELLLATTRAADVAVLHGDIHHGNVLDFGDRWAAIDPKGLIGHRAFDFANILCNPTEAIASDNLTARLTTISRQANLAPTVLADWAIAWCGLSLAWAAHAPSTSHSRSARTVAERLIGG